MDLKDQLILDRDIKQLQQDKSQIEEGVERKKRELLSVMDLVKKETEKLKINQELNTKALNEISNAQIKWNQEKREQEDLLDKEKIEVKKILNRESFIKTQEQKLKQTENGLIERETAIAEKEKGFTEREKEISSKEDRVNKLVKQGEQHLETAQEKVKGLKDKVLADINNW